MLDLSKLNPEQREAVTATEGALLVVAGPGSGKTAVIAARAAYIIDQGLAEPSAVLAVTFTNKAVHYSPAFAKGAVLVPATDDRLEVVSAIGLPRWSAGCRFSRLALKGARPLS